MPLKKIQNSTQTKQQKDNNKVQKKSIKIKKQKESIKKQNSKKIKKTSSLKSFQLQCETHSSFIEFICTNKQCLKELCGYCILEHKQHITHIVGIQDILKQYEEKVQQELVQNPQQTILELKEQSIINCKQLDLLLNQIKRVLTNQIENQKHQICQNSEKQQKIIESIESLKDMKNQENSKHLTSEKIQNIKQYLLMCNDQTASKEQIPIINENVLTFEREHAQNININTQYIVKAIEKAISQNIQIYPNNSFETTGPNLPKFLHWFDWGKQRINIYDIVENISYSKELDIDFNIPSFSRSIIINDSSIFIIGGEEPEYFSRKEMYAYYPLKFDNTLHQKASMPHKKFDFTLCYLEGYIYVLCGKNSSSEVVGTCDRYNIQNDSWEQIPNVNQKRYAASAVGCLFSNFIYLFGGRSDANNEMVQEIEQYQIQKRIWSIIEIKEGREFWKPVEICACIQISKESILIFGGSDAKIKDQSISVEFNVKNRTFSKLSELKRPQVFVTAPFLYGSYVYAIGNEYYMKHRNLHRFSLEKREWEIMF